MNSTKKRVFLVLIAAFVVLADQATKSLALSALADHPKSFGFLTLRIVYNRGTAFGFGANILPFLLIAGVVAFVVIFASARSTNSRQMVLALALVAGGALGNLFDRVFRGHGGSVVDFIDLGWWPTFNLADAAIVIGMILFIFESRHEHKRNSE